MNAEEIVKWDWPTFGLDDDIRPALASASEAGQTSALVTLYAAMGGSPRGIGTQMLIRPEGITGYLSGGCVEADVTRHAMETLQDGQPRWLVYGRGGPVDIRLPCGGRIEVLVERITSGDPAARALIEHARMRQPALWLSDGAAHACVSDAGIDGDLSESMREILAQARSSSEKAGRSPKSQTIYRFYAPRLRFVVIGSDPTALALATMASQVGMEVHFIRPKGPVSPPPVPAVRYWRNGSADALAEIGLDPWTSVAVATHQDDDDQEALTAALSSPAGYVGLLGSTRRLPDKLARLAAAGIAPDQLARLRAPIGLPLGGKSPWEIATGVIGEIYQILNAGGIVRPNPVRAIAAA